MLRKRLPDAQAAWPDPVLGVNLRDSLEDLQPGEAEKMQNCHYDGGTRIRLGSSALTTASQGAFRGRGGYRVYPQTASKFRVVAWDTKVATVSDAGVVGTVTVTLTSDQDVHFRTWSITDQTYVANKSNILGKISPAQAYATVTGINIPASPTMTMPFLDRLFAIQGDGVWSTSPRVDSVWSPNSSTWAIYRPSGGTGVPTSIHLHSLTGSLADPLAQLLIFQESSLTALTGTDFGSDVTLTTPPTGWDAALTLLAPNIGTKSPYSVVTVPGVGTFWFTQNANVAWLSFDSSVPKFVGDKLFSNRVDLLGVNNVNYDQLSQVRMAYQDRKLKLFLPVSGNAFSTIQYWLDMRQLQSIPVLADTAKLSWSGPHIGQSLSAVWVESAGGDQDAILATEGDSTVGMFVYLLNQATVFTDQIGAATQDVAVDYRSFYHGFGAPTYEKWIPLVRFDITGDPTNTLVTLKDLHGLTVENMTLTTIDGTALDLNYYDDSVYYGAGAYYGLSVAQSILIADVTAQSETAMLGDAIQVQVATHGGNFVLNQAIPQAQIRRTQPVS